MNQSDSITILICTNIATFLLGALGWFRWWYDIRQDRANLKVEASMCVKSDERGLRACIEISAVNNGRRPAKIKGISIPLSKEHDPIPMNLNAEQREQFVRNMRQTRRSSTLSNPNFLEIAADGGSYQWELPLRGKTSFQSEKRGNDTWGKGYVEFTSGKKLWFEFTIIPDEHLEQLLNPRLP
jgi:hypothetical protein